MPFDSAERVIYSKNPLIEVVCQLRFPRILAINEVVPVNFQEAIREKYPLYRVDIEQQQQITFEASGTNLIGMPRISQPDSIKNHRFSSADEKWHINLTSTFIALTTNDYKRWEDFKEMLITPLQKLLEIYKPAFFERVGLRYVDAFQRSKLGLQSSSWAELIQPFALGFLSNDKVMSEVKGYTSTTELDIGNTALARINTALGYVHSPGEVVNPESQELSFILDSDMFFGKKSNNEVWDSLEYLHGVSSKLLWAVVTEKLHNAMEPTPYESIN